MEILITGGAGYIGTHTAVELLNQGDSITVVDNLANSSSASLKRVEDITGQLIDFQQFNMCDDVRVEQLFATKKFDAVIHFAGLKAVGESVAKPLEYYQNNLDSTLVLCRAMQRHDVRQLVFSSSATVYGTPKQLPLTEDNHVGIGITNPYGRTKFMIEQILSDLVQADPALEVTVLRYFNPVGAHNSGMIGEDPRGVPNNLLPYILKVASHELPELQIYGQDYDTLDGTGVRDYIHVVDLAKGHIAALHHSKPGLQTYNLGTGSGISVLELVHAFEAASGQTIPYTFVDRRPGDVASCYADCSKARNILKWLPTKTIQEACQDAWRWQTQNPHGYN